MELRNFGVLNMRYRQMELRDLDFWYTGVFDVDDEVREFGC